MGECPRKPLNPSRASAGGSSPPSLQRDGPQQGQAVVASLNHPQGPAATLWSAADRGDTEKVKQLLEEGRDVNGRNCLGCTPLFYACGSGHVDTVRALLDSLDIDVNRTNNDRLTSFMLATQGNPYPSLGQDRENAKDKLRRLMDLPATDDLDNSMQDRWTALMEACYFGHRPVVELLLASSSPHVDLDALNIRGQRAEEVAAGRGHERLSQLIRDARQLREQPEELPKLRELQEQVEALKAETRNRLLLAIDRKHEAMADLKARQEREIESLTQTIDSLQEQLDRAMKSRLAMITRQVREVKNVEDDIRQMRRQLDNFDRFAGSPPSGLPAATLPGGVVRRSAPRVGASPPGLLLRIAAEASTSASGWFQEVDAGPDTAGQRHEDFSAAFNRDFECSVCLEEMRPPVRIFQCRNGHVMCETCKDHPDVTFCPSCRLPFLPDSSCLMRNIPMEKLARSFFERVVKAFPRSVGDASLRKAEAAGKPSSSSGSSDPGDGPISSHSSPKPANRRARSGGGRPLPTTTLTSESRSSIS